MHENDNGFTDNLLLATRSFMAGCFGFLGISGAAVVVLVTILIFQTQFTALIRAVVVPISAIVSGAPPVVATGYPGGQAGVAAIEVFVAAEDLPSAPHIVQLPVPVQRPPFICIRSNKGMVVHFSIRIVHPNGQIATFGEQFATDPSGQVVCLGQWANIPTVPGVYRIDAVVGTTVVGSTAVTLVAS